MKFRKKPVVIEAITFDQLIQHGRDNGANIVSGMPWSFSYNGHPISHENDQCYLIPTKEGTMNMTPADMLITGVHGEIYPCKKDIFDATYDRAFLPHQQRVVDELTELNDKHAKLGGFFDTPIFNGLPEAEQNRLRDQWKVMLSYSNILCDRIAAF